MYKIKDRIFFLLFIIFLFTMLLCAIGNLLTEGGTAFILSKYGTHARTSYLHLSQFQIPRKEGKGKKWTYQM